MRLISKIGSLSIVTMVTLLSVSCNNGLDSVADEGLKENTDAQLTSFSTGRTLKAPKVTRTSANNHQYLGGADFMWEAGDNILVKDDNNNWQTSVSSNITGTQASAKFRLGGTYHAGSGYDVRYVGNSTSAYTVTIATVQTQEYTNSMKHFGASGDCGTAMAVRVGDHFEFMLDHKASYLCFLPRVTNEELGRNIFLTHIIVKSDDNIAGVYNLDRTHLYGSGSSKEIRLNTIGAGALRGFPLNISTTNVGHNAAYMVIAPGTHNLTVEYHVKDPATNTEAVITKNLGSVTYEANKFYDITANLTPQNYSGKYYMWDAAPGADYWMGHEATQSKIPAQRGTDYATSAADARWYNSYNTSPLSSTVATRSAAACPNANEILWLVQRGDAHWDSDTFWSTLGHLYKGGMWIKKSAVIAFQNGVTVPYMKTKAPDGNNYVNSTLNAYYKNNTVVQGKPANTSDYIYIPALGDYELGYFNLAGQVGFYWSSTSSPFMRSGNAHPLAYYLYISKDEITLYDYFCYDGFQLWELQ